MSVHSNDLLILIFPVLLTFPLESDQKNKQNHHTHKDKMANLSNSFCLNTGKDSIHWIISCHFHIRVTGRRKEKDKHAIIYSFLSALLEVEF